MHRWIVWIHELIMLRYKGTQTRFGPLIGGAHNGVVFILEPWQLVLQYGIDWYSCEKFLCIWGLTPWRELAQWLPLGFGELAG